MVMATAAVECYTHHVNNNVLIKKSHLVEPLQNHHHGPIDPKILIGEALHRRAEAVDHELCEPGDEDTFFVADLGEVYRQHLRWKRNLPRVKPFYGEFYSLCLQPTFEQS